MMMRKVRDQPRTTQEELVNDLKAVGTTVMKRTISNTLHREGLKSCCTHKVPLLKKAHVQAHLKFAEYNPKNKGKMNGAMYRDILGDNLININLVVQYDTERICVFLSFTLIWLCSMTQSVSACFSH